MKWGPDDEHIIPWKKQKHNHQEAQNDAAIKEAIQELIKYRTEGHKIFK